MVSWFGLCYGLFLLVGYCDPGFVVGWCFCVFGLLFGLLGLCWFSCFGLVLLFWGLGFVDFGFLVLLMRALVWMVIIWVVWMISAILGLWISVVLGLLHSSVLFVGFVLFACGFGWFWFDGVFLWLFSWLVFLILLFDLLRFCCFDCFVAFGCFVFFGVCVFACFVLLLCCLFCVFWVLFVLMVPSVLFVFVAVCGLRVDGLFWVFSAI